MYLLRLKKIYSYISNIADKTFPIMVSFVIYDLYYKNWHMDMFHKIMCWGLFVYCIIETLHNILIFILKKLYQFKHKHHE